MFYRKIKNRISIVEKIIYRSLTGQTLGFYYSHSFKIANTFVLV